MLETADS